MDVCMNPPAENQPYKPKKGPAYKRMSVPGRQKELHWQTFFIVLGVTAAFFLPFIIMGHGYFFFRGDFNVQQIPFYQMCHQMVRQGDFFWNWYTDLGANFIGSYSFYLLGSPFFWLTIPFPNWMVPYLIGPLLILKFALSAFTAYFYIRRFTRTPRAAMIGAMLYAFSGFSIHNLFFNHFHEAIVFFPVLLLAVEQFIADNRRGALAVAVFICAITNYFFFFGMVIFCVIYWFIRMLSGCWELSFKRLLAFAFEVLLGVGLAAIILVPSYLSVMQNTRVDSHSAGWNALMYGKEQIYANIFQSFFFPPEVTGINIMVPSADVRWSSTAGWLPIFSMVGVIGFLQSKKKNWLRRVIITLIIMAFVPILNSAFYAFNSAYYARWFYMPVLMMALATAMSLEDKEVDWNRAFKWTLGITLGAILILAFFPAKITDGHVEEWGLYKKEGGDPDSLLLQFIVISAVAVASLITLKCILPLWKKSTRLFTRAAVAAISLCTVGYGIFFIAMGRASQAQVENDFIPRMVEGSLELPGDKDTYRVDVYEGHSNTAMFLGYSTIQAFHSIVPASIMNYYPYVGVERGVASRPDTTAYAVRPFLSVKYLITFAEKEFENNGQTKMPGYTFLEEQNGYKIYENDNYIPYGFTYDYYMTFDECDSYDESERALLMLRAMLLDDDQVERHQDILKNLGEDYLVTGNQNNQSIPPGTSAAEIMENAKQSANQKKPLDLGPATFAADCTARARTASKSFEADSRGFTAQVELDRENLVFFSVPYEENGWTATVDGQPVPIEQVNVGFMAVRVPAGAHQIRFNYMTPGLKEGILLTGASLLLLLCYLVVVVIWKRKRPHRWMVSYPEGDGLARRFVADQAEEEVRLAQWREGRVQRYVGPTESPAEISHPPADPSSENANLPDHQERS